MNIKIFTSILAGILVINAQSALAQLTSQTRMDQTGYSRHSISVEVGAVLVDSYAAVQYDYRFTEYLSIRGGIGMNAGLEGKSSLATSVLGNGLISLSGSKVPEKFLELGGGATYAFNIIRTSSQPPASHIILPAASLNYRYQPADGGITFRAGASFVYYSAGLFASFGYSF